MPKPNSASKPFSFTHLLGLGASSKSRRAEEEDDEEAKKAEEEEKDTEKDKKNGKKADEEDQDDKQEMKDSDEDDADDKPKEKGKKSGKKAEKDDEDDDDEDGDDEEKEKAELHHSSALARARSRERLRCASIFGSKAAAGRPQVAANLAFNTTMTAREAIAVMSSLGDAGASVTPLSARMRVMRNPDITPGAAATRPGNPASALAASIVRIGKEVAG